MLSGRNLAAFEMPSVLTRGTLTDVAVTGTGVVLVLDSTGPTLLRLRAGATTLESLMRLHFAGATSLAPADDGRAVYVAHRAGLARVDLEARRASPVTAPAGVEVGNLELPRSVAEPSRTTWPSCIST